MPILRNVRNYLASGLSVLLAVMLLATIYFTLFDLQWIAFLTGVLLAATAAFGSQASKVQWLMMRRTLQLQRAKDEVRDQNARRERAVDAQKSAEAHLKFVSDALPEMVLFVDREEHCRHHNSAFLHWRGCKSEEVDGRLLHEVLGNDVYVVLQPRVARVLTGEDVFVQAEWNGVAGARRRYDVSLLPFPKDATRATGFYVLFADTTGRDGVKMESPTAPLETDSSVGDAMVGLLDSGEPFYLQSMTEQLISRKDPRAQLVEALEDDHFLLYAQKFETLAADAPDQRCFEILLRLREEEENMLLPGGFFAAAERYNLMGRIDRWVVHNLLKWCSQKRDADSRWDMPLFCVNLSSASMCDSEFAVFVQRALRRREVAAGRLCFELGELDVISHYEATQVLMNALRPHGCRFTLDAFGSSKVAFGPMKDLTFDFLKIDGVIIQNLLTEHNELAKVRAITIASHRIGMRIIAEFVESDATLEKLREIGVDYAQGFGIQKPAPIAQVA